MRILIRNKKLILLDADVISHFIKSGFSIFLPKIFPNQLCVLDKVYNEVIQRKGFDTYLNNLLNVTNPKITFITFPEDNFELAKEFAALRLDRGIGEAACLSYARFNDNIVASSNLRDVKDYCKKHNIELLDTMSIVHEAYIQSIFTLDDCDTFIANVLSKNSKLPYKTMQEYLDSIEQ